MELTKQVFYEPVFHNKQFILQDGKIIGIEDSNSNNVDRYVIEDHQLISQPELLEVLNRYPNGEDGDRQLTQDNRRILFQVEHLLSTATPHIMIAGGVILGIGTVESNIAIIDNLANPILYSCMCFEKKDKKP